MKAKFRYSLNPVTFVIQETTGGTAGTAQIASAAGTLTFTQTLPKFNADACESVTSYPGTQTQTADPTIESHEGTGNVPAFRGTAYTVFKNLQITKWGAQLPNFEAIVRQADEPTIASVITNLLTRSDGLTADNIDVSAVSGTMGGIMMVGPTTPVQAIRQLQFAFRLDAQEDQSKIRFYQRENAEQVTIPDSDIQATSGKSDAPLGLRVNAVTDSRVPSQLTVTFQDIDNEYQPASRRFRRSGAPVDNERVIELTMSSDVGSMARSVKEALISTTNGRWQVEVDLPINHIQVLAGDQVLVNDVDGQQHTVRVSGVDKGANNLLKVSGAIEEPTSVLQVADFEEGSVGCSEGFRHQISPASVKAVVEDLPPFDDDSLRKIGLMVGSFAPGGLMGGANVFESPDGSEFNAITQHFTPVIYGHLTHDLGAPGTHLVYDGTNELKIKLAQKSVTLTNCTRRQAANGVNVVMVGREVLAFTTAVATSTSGNWTLTNLRRGYRGTENFMTHSTGEPVVMLSLSRGSLQFHEVGLPAVNTLREYRAVSFGGAVAQSAGEDRFIEGNSVKPFAPSAFNGLRDGSNNLTLSWRRRSRRLSRAFSGVEPPLVDVIEQYEIEVEQGGSLKATKTVTSATTFSYSAADQSSDGVTAGSPSTFTIYQISDLIGRGHSRSITV